MAHSIFMLYFAVAILSASPFSQRAQNGTKAALFRIDPRRTAVPSATIKKAIEFASVPSGALVTDVEWSGDDQGFWVGVLSEVGTALVRASFPVRQTQISNGNCGPLARTCARGTDGAEEVGEETIGGGFDAGIVLDDGEAEDVEVETDGGTGAFKIGEGVAGEEKFGANHAFDAITASLGATD